VVACAFLVAGFFLAAILIVSGATRSLAHGEQRLGADIVVVPEGTERQTEGALLMGKPMDAWMASSIADDVLTIPGVEAASPQLYFGSLEQAPETALPALFLVAYDPDTDFTVRPWLSEGQTAVSLGALAGSLVAEGNQGRQLSIYGYDLAVGATLEPTGTALDQSVFVSFATAEEISQDVPALEEARGFALPTGSISSIMVDTAENRDPEEIAADIRQNVPGVAAMTRTQLYDVFRTQMQGQQTTLFVVVGLVLVLCLGIIGLVFSMLVNQRRREIGVLRALGAGRPAVVGSFLASATVFALAGAVGGTAVFGATVFIFRQWLSSTLGFPFVFPSAAGLAALIAAGLGLALVAALVAAFVPAYRVSRQDPAIAMRE